MNYYISPKKCIAIIIGGVDREYYGPYANRGWAYLAVTALAGFASYLFLLFEYNII